MLLLAHLFHSKLHRLALLLVLQGDLLHLCRVRAYSLVLLGLLNLPFDELDAALEGLIQLLAVLTVFLEQILDAHIQ